MSLTFSVSGQYLKNGLTDSFQIWHVAVTSFQIWHVAVTSFQDVPYFKVTLNSHVQKNYVEFKFLFFHRV